MPLLTLLGQVSASKTIGGTTQLSALTSTGGLNVFTVNTVGGTSQLGPITSTGGLNVLVTRTVGGTDQLAALSSTGGIQAGDIVDGNTGGWFWFKYEQEQLSRQEKKRQRLEKRKEAERIQSDLDKALALAERDIEEKESRREELEDLTKLANEYESEIRYITNEKIAFIAKDAMNRATYSSMERLERELGKIKEEEEFLILATQIILNG